MLGKNQNASVKPITPEDTTRISGADYEADFKRLKTDLVDSFNQWRRHVTVRIDGFAGGDRSSGDDAGNGVRRGQGVRYHRYQVRDRIPGLPGEFTLPYGG